MELGVSFYNSILDCCVESQRYDLLEEIFAEIENKPNCADESTYSIYLKGLAKAKKLVKVTEEYEKLKDKKNIKLDEAIYNQIIDCYSKNNQEDKIISVYNDMKEKQVKLSLLSYGLFIRLYCNKGDCNKAFEGMHPTLVHVPPSAGPPAAFFHSSIQATWKPSCAARIAAT